MDINEISIDDVVTVFEKVFYNSNIPYKVISLGGELLSGEVILQNLLGEPKFNILRKIDKCVYVSTLEEYRRHDVFDALEAEWDAPVFYHKSEKYISFYVKNEYDSPSVSYGTPYPKNRKVVELSVNPNDGLIEVSLKAWELLLQYFKDYGY